MKRLCFYRGTILASGLLTALALAAPQVWAQARRAAGPQPATSPTARNRVIISKIEGIGRAARIKTPVYNVTINENFFQGHFPAHPVMPGVLIIESMAQTAAVLVVQTLGPDAKGKLVYFMSIEGAKFRKPVGPGDQMRIHCVKQRSRGAVWKFHAEAKVDGVVVAEATYAAMILDR